jgi:NADH:ubiquinone oxidoreductase subunit E
LGLYRHARSQFAAHEGTRSRSEQVGDAPKPSISIGVDWHGTTSDGGLTVEPVYCLGLCATSPSCLLDGEPLGRLDAGKITEALEEARAS